MENCLERMIEKINDYLLARYSIKGFPERSFYGEAFFAAALAKYNNDKYHEDIKKLIKVAEEKSDKLNSTLHWEFNNYAILQILKDNPEYRNILTHEFYYGKTKSTNWIFLRQLCKCMESNEMLAKEFKKILNKRQLENGLILDAKNVSSLQYHCFSAVLLHEIYEVTHEKSFLNRFIKAAEFIKNFTLRDGESIYIGRGQEQIFGYGSLIYLYELAYKETGNTEYRNLQSKCIKYVYGYFEEKMIPLVISDCETESDKKYDINSLKHLGWYSYNNYYDYLPFFCYFITKTLVLKKNNGDIKVQKNNKKISNIRFVDTHFLRYSNNNYDAVLSCYPGADANYMVLPYIVSECGNITPCYGGEKAHSCTLYPDTAIPLPYLELKNYYIGCIYSRSYLIRYLRSIKNKTKFNNIYCIWQNQQLIIKQNCNEFIVETNNSLCNFKRIIKFEETAINIEDILHVKTNIECSKFVPLNLSFYKCIRIEKNLFDIGNGWKLLLEEKDLSIKEKGYCAKGRLNGLEQEYTNIKLKNGDVFNYNYKIFT